MPTQREAFRRAVGRWAVETGDDAGPLLLVVANMLGHPEGDQPLDMETSHHPSAVVSLEAVTDRIAHLVDVAGVGEDFLITGLVRAVEEHLARVAAGRQEALASFAELLRRIDGVLADAAATAAFKAEHGLGDPDLPAMREHVCEEIERLRAPAWEQAQQRRLQVWRRASRGLLDPGRRAAWEAARFEHAAQKLDQFFKGPEGAELQPMPPREE